MYGSLFADNMERKNNSDKDFTTEKKLHTFENSSVIVITEN